MKLGRLNHVGVATPSIEKSVALYRDLASGVALGAQQPASTSTQPAKTMSHGKAQSNGMADQAFVKEAALGGMAEVDLGELASMKAQVYKDPRPKEYFDRFHERSRTREADWVYEAVRAVTSLYAWTFFRARGMTRPVAVAAVVNTVVFATVCV